MSSLHKAPQFVQYIIRLNELNKISTCRNRYDVSLFGQRLSPLKINSVLSVVAESYDSLNSAYRTIDKSNTLVLLILYF